MAGSAFANPEGGPAAEETTPGGSSGHSGLQTVVGFESPFAAAAPQTPSGAQQDCAAGCGAGGRWPSPPLSRQPSGLSEALQRQPSPPAGPAGKLSIRTTKPGAPGRGAGRLQRARSPNVPPRPGSAAAQHAAPSRLGSGEAPAMWSPTQSSGSLSPLSTPPRSPPMQIPPRLRAASSPAAVNEDEIAAALEACGALAPVALAGGPTTRSAFAAAAMLPNAPVDAGRGGQVPVQLLQRGGSAGPQPRGGQTAAQRLQRHSSAGPHPGAPARAAVQQIRPTTQQLFEAQAGATTAQAQAHLLGRALSKEREENDSLRTQLLRVMAERDELRAGSAAEAAAAAAAAAVEHEQRATAGPLRLPRPAAGRMRRSLSFSEGLAPSTPRAARRSLERVFEVDVEVGAGVRGQGEPLGEGSPPLLLLPAQQEQPQPGGGRPGLRRSFSFAAGCGQGNWWGGPGKGRSEGQGGLWLE